MTLDLLAARASCEAGLVGDSPPPLDWLRESWREPDAFFRALVEQHARHASPASKSHPGEGFDFAHDLVLRHPPERTALLASAPRRGLRALSYGELEQRSRRLADDWSARGLEPGAPVCLLLPLGEELVVALIAALRLGLVITLLPPGGPRWLAPRLASTRATVVTTRDHASLVRANPTIFLGEPPRAKSASRRASFTYAPDAVAARLFSQHTAGHEPLPLRARDLYLGALRDGLLALSLRPGDALAAPGTPLVSHQPALLLAALACGATYVHLELDAIAADPSLLTALPLRAIGVTAALRDLLARAGDEPLRWAHWFRDPEERLDWPAWRRFIAARRLGDTPASNLLVDASTGGAVLWSLRRRGRVHVEVLPAAGAPWTLGAIGRVDADGRGPEASGDVGLFARAGDERRPYLILMRSGDELVYGGTWDARVDGRVYPGAEVAAVASALPFVEGAHVVLDRAGPLGQTLRVLVAFTGARVAGASERRALDAALVQALGPELLPDRVLLVPLYPRRADDGVALDEPWCERQYAAGRLHHKPRQPFYQLLTRLRASAVATRRP